MRATRVRIFAALTLLLGVWFYLRKPALAMGASGFTGTYGDMYYNNDAGDVVGEELKIVVAEGGRFQGVLQFAAGVPQDLMLVEIKIIGNKISFNVPAGHLQTGEFSGTIDGGAIRGQFRFKSGATESATLKKGKSYWD